MALKKILLGFCIVSLMASCEVLQQAANQNQNKGNGGNNQNNQVKLEGKVECNLQGRYASTIFPAGNIKIFKDVTYATMSKKDQWNNGNNTANCYGGKNYKTVTANGQEELKMDIYMPDPSVDNCTNRALIILVHHGGFSQVGAPNKSVSAGRAKFMAQLGYVVAVIDYRKGYDFGQNNTYQAGSLTGQIYKSINVNCKESGTPDPNSFHVAMFRIIQDIRASHRFLHKNSDKISIDPNKIFYAGLSTGAVGIAHAAYASDETAHWNKLNLGGIEDFGNHPELENQIKVAGVLAEQPALQDINWMEASDNVPIYMMQGEADVDVPFTKGYLGGITSYNGGQKGMAAFQLYGSKAMYDKMKTFGGETLTKGHLTAFEGINHYVGPVTNGQCAALNGGQRGIWMEAYQFAKNIIDATESGQLPDIKNGYCLYKNPKSANCQPICE